MNLPLPAKKSLGQHWLKDNASLRAIGNAAELKPNDTVLEIGPGHGSLTKLLLEAAEKVIAVELDNKLAAMLKNKFISENLDVINEDILKFNLNDLPSKYKLVANIPYYLTNNLLRVLSESKNPPKLAVLLVQKEVAERVAAVPGQMSLLGVSVQFYWEVALGAVVPKELFEPVPKIDSQVIILKRRNGLLYSDISPKAFFTVVRSGFSQKRKTLLNSLSAGLRLDKNAVNEACKSVDIDPKRRPQTLSLEEWHNLALSLNT